MPRFRVAHVKLMGADVVLVPVAPEFAQLGKAEQAQTFRQVEQLCRSARLGGEIVPVWETGAATLGFLAEERLHKLVGNHLTPQFLKNNTNREVTAPVVGALAARVLYEADGPGPVAPAAPAPRPDESATRNSAAMPDPMRGFDRPRPGAGKGKQQSRVVTMLFTDLVNSTRMKQDLGDIRGTEAIRRHHDFVRKQLAMTPGQEISTSGDSFFLIFPTPSEAVKFALIMQNRLPFHVNVDGFKVEDRIGIHLGEVFVEEASGAGKELDFFGIHVDTCARIMSMASGGQILMSRFAYDSARPMLRGQVLPGIGDLLWMNHGNYEIKGVGGALEVCEVGEAGRAPLVPPKDSPAGKKV
jgi:class 3 adenylate cyclase